jgi:hypothetical protein
MVAVCVVVNTLFPVVSAIEEIAANRYRVTVRHEDGTTNELCPELDVATKLYSEHGADIQQLVGKPWRAILASLPQ